MAIYDAKNIQFVWKGITLTGTGDDHAYNLTQQNDSFTTYKGVQGEGLNIVNNQRQWRISRSFKVDSKSMPMLLEDNLNCVEDTLVLRDLNTGRGDVFSECVVINVSGEKDSGTRIVTWNALGRNNK